jgi:alpha-1,3-rhamnosyl/mannosyltransferase
VVTVHDVGFLRLPGVRPPEMTTAVERAFMAALRRADAIVADSAFTAREAAEATGIDAARFRVVHCALPPAAPATPHDAGEPYLLALGTAEPRKNLAVLIEAWGILAGRGKPPLLLICGSCDTPEGERLRATVARLGLAGRVRFLGFSPQAQVRSLLAGASGLLFPSRYEGFGYPLLEAFREGCPVAAADAGSLPEIGGPAVLLLPPDDPAAWADTASALVAADAATRGRLVAAGRTRLAAFGLDAMAAGHLAAYQEAV